MTGKDGAIRRSLPYFEYDAFPAITTLPVIDDLPPTFLHTLGRSILGVLMLSHAASVTEYAFNFFKPNQGRADKVYLRIIQDYCCQADIILVIGLIINKSTISQSRKITNANLPKLSII